MKNYGMEFGSHSCSHTSLTNIPLNEVFNEMYKSKKLIEKNLKIKCKYFAFPFGSYNDFNNEIINISKEVGYEKCFLNVFGINNISNNMSDIKRIIINETTKKI